MTLPSNNAWPFKSAVMLHLPTLPGLHGETWILLKELSVHNTSSSVILFYPILQLKEISLSIICLVVQVDKYTTSILETAKSTMSEIV